MTTSSRKPISRAKPTKKTVSKAGTVKSKASRSRQSKKSATSIAIATELAPAVAIALLEKTEQPAGAPAPALDCLAAAASPSEEAGKVRVQLMFENGAVLPVEMTTDAGEALSKALSAELQAER